MDQLIKQNINFLEYPLWMINTEMKEWTEDKIGKYWKGRNGYIYRCAYGVPDKTDSIFLSFWLMEAQKNNWSRTIETTKYRTLKECGMPTNGTQYYNRIQDSFWYWRGVTIGFKGIYFDNKEYKTKLFGIIESVEEEKGKPIKITFNEKFLYEIQHSDYCKYINFDEVKELRWPIASRLHEILCKNFKGRNIWEIDPHKLADKIPLNTSTGKYLSHILAKIKPAINRINKHTELKISLEVRESKTETGKSILVFRKLANKKEETAQNIDTPKISELSFLVNLIPRVYQDNDAMIKLIDRYLKSDGFDYVKKSIDYTNKNIKNENGFRVYLAKVLTTPKEDNPKPKRKLTPFERSKKAIEERERIRQEEERSNFV
jgi:hypothetical protein